jgi:hypothetical protein
MKNIQKLSLLISFCFIQMIVQAQDQQVPKEEFLFVAASNVATVQRGEISKLPLEIRRSKRYQKSNAELTVGSTLPTGITAAYEESTGVLTSTTLVITASHDAAAGEYNVILNCTLNNKRKGVIVKVKVI